MKPMSRKPVFVLTMLKSLLFILLLSVPLHISSQESVTEDKTTSPYFFVQSEDTTVDQLPLKATSAEVNISGIIAEVRVKQTYRNEGTEVLEAIYVFPASTKAAVHYMHMVIGDRRIVAKIEEKQKARQDYEEAKEEGKTATLLEQDRPNVFTMNVANILPGDTIEVEMHYTELITPNEGIYQFVYPTVVGPRYCSPSEDGEKWTGTPYLHEGEKPPYTFEIKVNINAGLPVRELSCTSHPAAILSYSGNNTATCVLDSSASDGGNKDLILDYCLSGNEPESGLLLYQGIDENFFLAMIQPQRNPMEYEIPPREYIFIMDVSGSMHGFPISVSKTLLVNLISNLRFFDQFNVLFFAGGNQLLSEVSLPATSENIQKAINMIEQMQGGGGTELLPALERALNLQCPENMSRTFVIATDGYVYVEKEAFDLIRNNLSNANFFPFGIGSSVNRYIIEGMAHAGMSEPFVITNEDEAYEQAEKFRQYIQYPVLTNVTADITGFQVYDTEPLAIPDVLAERPVILFGKWKGNPAGSIQFKGQSGDAPYSRTLNVSDYVHSERNAALRYLWARHRIQLLDDYGSARGYYDKDSTLIKEIIRLGIKYNLLTSYTSFIAIDSLIRRDSGDIVTVKQPLPLPEGVSDYALSENMTGAITNSYATSLGSYDSKEANVSTMCDSCSFLEKNSPNPFAEYTILRFHIAEKHAEENKLIEIYDSFGRKVIQHDVSSYGSGWHSYYLLLQHKSTSLSPGIYYLKLKVGNKYANTLTISKL
ncbi:MAG: VWA domain-containing protein [Bacteroidales bacterium]|nr:VWA domain-containing protein [Bacteroidales bacterium]